MKLGLVLLALLAGIWLWRKGRIGGKTPVSRAKPTPASKAAPQQDMVSCVVCQLHLPKTEALQRGTAWYCCEGHRQLGKN
jgi:uncharacterized protein